MTAADSGSIARPAASARSAEPHVIGGQGKACENVHAACLRLDPQRVADTHAPDDAHHEVRARFSERQLVNLTTRPGLINLWNRLAIGFRSQHPITVKAA